MDEELIRVQNGSEVISLYPGIELRYAEVKPDLPPVRLRAAEHTVQINYCRAGQIAWKTENGSCVCLGPGDFSLHMAELCANSAVTFPTGRYSGLAVCIDLPKADADPPELLRETGLLNEALRKKLCRDSAVLFFEGNGQTESIFSGFYRQPDGLKLPYQRIKALELLLYLQEIELTHQNKLTAYRSNRLEVVREIHDRLIQKIGTRVTIEELSRQYLINPTTLKAAFKTVYGTSIAAHIKEHRMKKAAEMLRGSDMSIAEIAQAVGYDSPSKFTAAFKAFFNVLPKEYKKKY